jgi:hypothetical protein
LDPALIYVAELLAGKIIPVRRGIDYRVNYGPR